MCLQQHVEEVDEDGHPHDDSHCADFGELVDVIVVVEVFIGGVEEVVCFEKR